MYPQTVLYPIKVKTNQLVKLKHIETFRLVYISVSYRYFRHFATFSTRIPLGPMVVYVRADTLRTLPCWNKKITRDSAQDVSGGCVHKKLRLLATFSVCCPLASSVRKVTMTVHACACAALARATTINSQDFLRSTMLNTRFDQDLASHPLNTLFRMELLE